MRTTHEILGHSLSYCDPKLKSEFHRIGKKELKAVADALGLKPGEYEIRSNKGGIAVSGEVTLHGEWIYVQVSESVFSGRHMEVLYRTCEGRKDYTGGHNHFSPASVLRDPVQFAATLRRIGGR